MNDLERNLKELFESKAGDVQTTPLAPKAVLRRGRRRQVGTVVGGALMAVAAAALVIGGASAFLNDRADAPPMGDRDALPARTATIGGVTVTAPEGWSLMDQWPLGMNIGTETCSTTFEGTATPVGDGAGAESDQPIGTATAEECTPVDLPGGVPLFTLSNVEPNPTQTVCRVMPGLPTQAVGPTDVFLYVAVDPNADGASPVWPQTFGDASDASCGDASIVRWRVDGVSYLAAAAIGEDASSGDRDALLEAFESLGFQGTPQMAAAPVLGFVVAAGIEDGTAWRLEAGPNLACESGACPVGLVLVTTDEGGAEQAIGISPPADGASFEATSQQVGDVEMAFGVAAPDVVSVEVVSSDGTSVIPTHVPWPASLRTFAPPDAPIDGTIWWASAHDVTTADAVLEDGTGFSIGTGQRELPPDPGGSDEPTVAELRLDTHEEGDELVATGNAFGNDWELRAGPLRHSIDVEGVEPRSFSVENEGGTRIDVPGGTVAIWQGAPGGGPLTVTVDGSGETLVGRWMPSTDALGKEGRLWILPLPGVGSGLERSDADAIPIAISWPADRSPEAGVVVSSGLNGDGVSWKFAFTDPDCLVLAQVAGDPTIGQTECLGPATDGSVVAQAAGAERSLIAVMGRGDLSAIYAEGAGARIFGGCSSGPSLPGWEDTGMCAIVIPNDEDVVLRPSVWDPESRHHVPVDAIAVIVSDGQLVTLEGG